MPKNIKNIVRVADLKRRYQSSNIYDYDASMIVNFPVDTIYDIGEYDDEDGYIKFTDGHGWYVGCVDGIHIEFDDGSHWKFHGFYNDYGSKDPVMISKAIAELRRIIFDLDNEDEPETDMPDIF